MDLPIIWFILLGALLAGYAILDGFDLAVGMLHWVARTDHDRRLFLNSIGPIWDGNEVWLITFGGALFAAFPEAYATIFSGFYTVFMTVAMFVMHGAIYLYLKVLHDRVREWMWHTWGVFLVLYILGTIYTLIAVPRVVLNAHAAPWAAGIVVLNVLAIANIPRAIYHNAPVQAFCSSCASIGALVCLFGIAVWPNLVTARNNPQWSLTIWRAASSRGTLGIMLIIALIGMPLVLTDTCVVYWTFRRRVEIGKHSY